MLPVQSLTCKSIYSTLVDRIRAEPTSIKYIKSHLSYQEDINWKDVFTICRKTTVWSKMRNFQYKTLFNILFLNNKLFKMTLCSLYKRENETPLHLFSMPNNQTALEEFTRVDEPMFYSSRFNN